ncbi:MAG: hypothetical protein HKO93_02425 [Flavobacteriales bacterium]|nr:hypothetical protein [Flavobacteriales bacterium]
MNRFVFDRSDNGPPGAYMALFTIAWSVAHIFGHNLGMRSVDNLGYSATWWLCAVCLVIAALFIVILKARVRQEENRQ